MTRKLINDIRGTESFEARKPMYDRVQEILFDQVPDIFLYAPVTRLMVSKRFDCEITAMRPGYLENMIRLKNKK